MNNKTIESKEVFISQFPNSFTRTMLELMVKHPNESYIVVVAKLYPDYNEWLAYHGYPDVDDLEEEYKDGSIAHYCKTIRTDVQVLAKGDVLDTRTAKALFPERSHLKYRME